MKKVLIVDDTNVVRTFLANKLKPRSDKFEVLTAKNGKEAINIVKSCEVSLVITDIEMPVMDGFELLAYMSNNYPEIPMFVMTAKGSPDVEARINELGSLKYFEKPMDIAYLSKCILEELDSGPKGQIQGIGLAAFLQLVEIEGKTCTLKITSRGKTGKMYCFKGNLYNAEVGDLQDEEAAYELLSWDNAIIEIENTIGNKTKVINKPLMSVLMEGLRQKDEKQQATRK